MNEPRVPPVPGAEITRDELTRPRGWGLLAAVIFGFLCALGAVFQTTRFLWSYLMALVFWVSIPLGCLALWLLGHVAPGGWTIVIRRTLEAGARTLLPMGLLFVPVLLGVYRLYPWTSQPLGDRAVYLNVPFFVLRTVLYFAVWAGVTHVLSRMTREQDETFAPALPRRMRKVAALGLLAYGLTVSFAAIDWMMSLQPRWWSTIFGIYFIGGQGVAGMSFAILVAYFLRRRPDSVFPTVEHFHAFGKMLLAFVMLWAYFAFSQLLVIWSGNLPQEIPFYLDRSRGPFWWVSFVLAAVGFVVPFLLLLPRDLKRDPRGLAIVAGICLAARWVDVYWLVAPAFHPDRLGIHWLDPAAFFAVGGVWVVLFTRELAKRPLVPLGEPMLAEAVTNG